MRGGPRPWLRVRVPVRAAVRRGIAGVQAPRAVHEHQAGDERWEVAGQAGADVAADGVADSHHRPAHHLCRACLKILP